MKTANTLRLAIINTVGFSASTVMPLWLGGIAGHFGMPSWFAGLAVAVQLGSAALFNLATPVLFHRVPLLLLARMAMAVAGIAYLLALLPSPVVFLAALVLSGAALGTGLNVINRLMGSSEHVQHGYALFVVMEVVIATILFLTGSMLIARFGLMAVFAEVAVVAGLAFLLLMKLPAEIAIRASSGAKDASVWPREGFIGLAAFACFFIGQATINAFMPIIGQETGLSFAVANQAIALGMAFGFAGGMLARFVGERVKPVVPVLIVTIVLACTALLLTFAQSAAVFRAGVFVLAGSTMFVVPYFFAQLGAFDRSGRFTGFGPAMMLTGLAIGPGTAVLLRQTFGLSAVGLFSSVMLLLSGVVFLLALRVGVRRGTENPQAESANQAAAP